jgi:hypothetical protein
MKRNQQLLRGVSSVAAGNITTTRDPVGNLSLAWNHHDRNLKMSASQPVSCNGVPSPYSQLCCAAGYICTTYAGCVLPDDDLATILDQRPCVQLLDPLDADYVPPPESLSTAANISSPTGDMDLSPRSDAFQIIFVYPVVVFVVLTAIALLAFEMRRRRRRDLRDWEALRAVVRRQDDPELPSYAEHWRTGAQLRVDVESGGVQPPKYPEAVLDVADPRAAARAPRTPPPVYS